LINVVITKPAVFIFSYLFQNRQITALNEQLV
jgi:hypothetical protein